MGLPSVAYLTSPNALGVDHWRVHGPAFHLQRMGHPVAVVPLGRDMVAADVLVASQRASSRAGAFDHVRDRLCRPNRMLLVVDVCDDPDTTEGFVGARRVAAMGADGWSARDGALDAIRAADLVTVNSPAMATIARRHNSAVEVVPDLIDGSRWVPPYYDRPDDTRYARRTFVGVAGGESHADDWRILADVWPRIAAAYPGVGFVCIGYTPEYLVEAIGRSRLISIPFQPADTYQRSYIGLDIGCAPLIDAAYNRSKSPIKWYEYSLAGAATVASPTVYGAAIEDGRTGLLATTADEWVEAIERLLSRTYRNTIIRAARQRVTDHHSLSDDRLRQRLEMYRVHYRRVYGSEPATERAA